MFVKNGFLLKKLYSEKHRSTKNILVSQHVLLIFRFLAALRHHLGVEYHQHQGEMF